MSFSIHNCEIPKQWNNWFVTLTNRHNYETFSIEEYNGDGEENSSIVSKDNWKLYISMHLSTGEVFKTSSIEQFNPNTMGVTTKNGSNYTLGNPLNNNDNLLTFVKEYFEIN
jgi:hypothetical protein